MRNKGLCQTQESLGLCLGPDFRNLLVRTTGSHTGRFEIVKTARGFYRLLNEFSQGNPAVAMHYWLESLKMRRNRRVEVSLFSKPDDTALRDLDERQLFALTAIAQHDNLNADELARVVEIEPGLCRLDLAYLSDKGFLKWRRMRGLQNKYFYQYNFTIDGEETNAQFMRLPSAAKAG